jgi:hypothetical protein
MSKHRVTAVLLFALATEAPIFAQVKSSAITGTVTDQTGAVLPNATVTVVEQSTNTTTAAQSDGKGEYTVPYLPLGHYTLTVTVSGFQTYRKTDINLASATTLRADVPMSVGNTATSIDVKADALTLQTENATVSAAVSSETITTLPNINSNSLYFATLESGVQATPQQLNSQSLGVGYADRRDISAMRINGGELGSNDVQLDGSSIQGAAWHETAVLPNPDALSEVRVTTNNFTADIGMAQGVVSQTTKSGTNKFHGDLNFMLRNEDLNANSFSNKHQGIVRPTYRLLQGGGSIGGPIIIPKLYNGTGKLFFFGSFLRLTHSVAQQLLATVPTAMERQGNFSQTMISGNNGQPVNVNIYNPYSVTPVAGSNGTLYQRAQYANAIVTNPNAFGLKILQGYPNPNNGTFNGIANNGQNAYHLNNYFFSGNAPETRNSFNGRIDYKLGAAQSFYLTGGISKGSLLNPNRWGTAANGTWVNQATGIVADSNPYGAIGDTIVINPTTVLDIRYGLTHINTQAQINRANGDATLYGQPSFVQATAPFQGVLPELGAVAPYSALNNNSYANKSEHQLNHSVNGSLTKQVGKFSLKFGAEYRVYLQNWQDIQLQSPTLTTTAVTGQYATSNGTNASSTNIPLNQDAGFLPAGWVTGAEGWTMAAGTVPVLALASKYTAIYSQNSFRPSKKWQLTFGLRYEIQPGPTERYNRMSSYNVSAANPFATGASGAGALGLLTFPGVGGYSRNLYETAWNNFAPRTGVTYQLDDKTVLRGGYGRNYLPSNTGFNANGTIYGPAAFAPNVNPIPFGLSPAGVAVGSFDQPSNTYVVPAPGAIQSPNNYGTNGGVDVLDRYRYKVGHTDQWNVFIERQLSSTWLVNAGYVGSKSGLLPWRQFPLNGNFAVPAATLAGYRATWLASNGTNDPSQTQVANPVPALIGHASGASGGATITAIQSQMPYLAALGETVLQSPGSSAYNAFIVKVQHSMSHGLMVGANYTWSKTTGIVGSSNNQTYEENQESNSSGPSGGIDYVNFQNNHGLTNNDTPNRLVVNGSYALPFGKGKWFGSNALVDEAIGGWQVTAALTMQSGNPWAPNCAVTGANSGPLNGRCNRVAGQPIELPQANQHYYDGVTTLTLPDGRIITPAVNTYMKWNPDAWADPTVTSPSGKVLIDQYTNGSTPISIGYLRTPGLQNLNLSVIKRFPITERVAFDFHVNATNALNHSNHQVVNNTVGAITASNAATNAVAGQNSNVSFGSWGLTTLEARQLTVQANFTF